MTDIVYLVQNLGASARNISPPSTCTCTQLIIFLLPVLVDGGWSEWGQWTGCLGVGCRGIKTTVRTCTNPMPAYGGKSCQGNPIKTEKCERNCNYRPPSYSPPPPPPPPPSQSYPGRNGGSDSGYPSSLYA